MNKQQPEALRLAEMLTANEWPGHVTLVSYARECVAELRRQHARITELESQLAQRFDAAGQATAAQAVVQDDLITIRKPTTSAEMLWLLKLARLVVSDVGKTLEKTFAPAQPAAQQEAIYAATPTSSYAGRVSEEGFLIGTCPLYTADQLHAFADATHTLRASNGQAPAGADEYPALVCDYCGALTPDPWHSSGMLHGKMSKHIHSCDACAAREVAKAQASREQLTRERIQDLLLCGNPTDEEMRLIRIGWDAAHGIKGGQHG